MPPITPAGVALKPAGNPVTVNVNGEPSGSAKNGASASANGTFSVAVWFGSADAGRKRGGSLALATLTVTVTTPLSSGGVALSRARYVKLSGPL